MIVESLRFGEIEVEESKILRLSAGLHGLEEHTRYALLSFEDSYPILWIQSLSDKGVCLPVIDSFLAYPSYSFDLSDQDIEDIEVSDIGDVNVVSVVVIPAKIEEMTVNLAAPIVINTRTAMAKQVILSGGEYNVRHPVFNRVVELIKEGDASAGAVAEA